MGAVTYPTLEHVAMQGRPYPTELLDGCETGLVLFAAAYMGHNDAVHFAEAGMDTTCVDIDSERIALMRTLYPHRWTFLAADAWVYAEAAKREELVWDAVSVDTFTGDAMERSLQSLDLWCSLAGRLVTVTIANYALESYSVPAGWQEALYERSNGVHWLVLTRD